MTLRKIASPNRNRIDGIKLPKLQIAPLTQADLGGGMNTVVDPADIADNEFTLQANCRSRNGFLVRRPGKALFTPLKPNSNKVLRFSAFNKNDGTVYLLRFTPTTVHFAQAGAWIAATGALVGGASDRFTTAVVDDRLFFTNNGANKIQEFLPAGPSFGNLGNAPEYKYVTGFGDHAVGFNLSGATPDPTQIGWSGLRNYAVWDSITDKSAGFQPLVESASDQSDFGTGVFGFANTIQIFRERSIWEGTKTGSPTQPFNFYTKIPGIGSDSPYAITRIPLGLAFPDSRTRQVYIYGLDGSITPIGTKILDTLFNDITNPKNIFGAYHQQTKDFQIVLPDPNSTYVRIWTYNLEDKVWSYDEGDNISSLDVLDYSSSALAYNDLLGSYNQLVGNYNDLINNNQVVTKFYGYSSGELTFETASVDDDFGSSFTAVAESKDFELPELDQYVAEIRFNYEMAINGNIVLEYSIDAGDTWKTAKNITATTASPTKKLMTFKRLIKTRRFKYRVTSASGLWKISNFETWISTGGDSRK